MSNLDILSQLPHLKWRNIEVPCQTNSVSFEQAHALHKQHGLDGAHVESLGRNPAKFSFKIPFRVGIAGFPNLYPETFRDFWNACLDNSLGVLSHPEFGDIDCKVSNFSLSFDPNSRSGYDADVSWVETSEQGKLLDQNKEASFATSAALVKSLDDVVFKPAELSEEFKKKYIDDKGKLKTNLVGAMRSIRSAMYSVNSSIEGVRNQIGGAITEANALMDDIGAQHSKDSARARRILADLELSLSKMRDGIATGNAKKIAFVIATAPISVGNAASGAGMEYDEFLKTNPKLGRKSEIAKGTEYFIYV